MNVEAAIDAIPGGEGWWRTMNYEIFVKLANTLVSRGIASEEAVDILTAAYQAVADEFGS